MQVMRAFQRIEIAFWIVMVALMKDRRLVALGILTMALVMCLSAVGIADLVLTFSERGFIQKLEPAISQPYNKISTPAVGQRNILVVLVDSLSAEQIHLEGIWLVGKLASNPQLVFFPIFPDPSGSTVDKISGLFHLDENGMMAGEFIDYLHTKNIHWDNYLLIDRSSLADLIELAGKINWEGKSLSGPAAVAKMPIAQLDPRSALQAQAYLAQELCQNVTALIQNADPSLVWGLLTHRMRSDFDLATLQSAKSDIDSLAHGPSCEFPTLQTISLLVSTD